MGSPQLPGTGGGGAPQSAGGADAGAEDAAPQSALGAPQSRAGAPQSRVGSAGVGAAGAALVPAWLEPPAAPAESQLSPPNDFPHPAAGFGFLCGALALEDDPAVSVHPLPEFLGPPHPVSPPPLGGPSHPPRPRPAPSAPPLPPLPLPRGPLGIYGNLGFGAWRHSGALGWMKSQSGPAGQPFPCGCPLSS